MEKNLRFTKWLRTYTQNTFQNNACFTKLGQFHNGASKKTSSNPNPHPTKIPNPSRHPKPLKNPNP